VSEGAAAVECEVRNRLLFVYSKTASNYAAVTGTLTSTTARASKSQYDQIYALSEHARGLSEKAWAALDNHIRQHGCRYETDRISRDKVARILQDEVQRKKDAIDFAQAEFKEATANIPSGLPSPDGTDRITNAGKSYRFTLDAYKRAVREYETFILTATFQGA
jgi:hypothetical protein